MHQMLSRPMQLLLAALLLSGYTHAQLRQTCRRPAPPPPPGPAPPAPGPRPGGHDPSYYATHTTLAPGITMHATMHPLLRDVEILLQAKIPAGKTVAWLGLGISPNGTMAAGSFMVGWNSPDPEKEGCVVATSLGAHAPSGAPTGPAGFAISDTAFAVYDGYALLQVRRPLHDTLPGHSSIARKMHVLWAAGSKAPHSCSSVLESADYHDVFHDSKEVDVSPDQVLEHPPARFALDPASTVHATHELGYTTVQETLYSQSYFLKDGDLIFTQFEDTLLPMPSGDYAILSLVGGLVDCNNESVPLDVVYNHHWLMKPIAGPTTHYNSPCPDGQAFSYVFGVGAESRKTPTVIPQGYGYHVQNGTVWGANIHVLHTQNIAGGAQGVKECIECWAGPRKACGLDPKQNGSFACCQSGTCPVVPGKDRTPTEYKMKIVITYTRDVSMVKPVDVETYLSPGCQYEYLPPTHPPTQSINQPLRQLLRVIPFISLRMCTFEILPTLY